MTNTEWNKILRVVRIKPETILPDGDYIRNNGSDFSLISSANGNVIINTCNLNHIKELLVD